MPNVHNKFTDPAGSYAGGYTSKTLSPTPASHRSIQTRGIIQVDIAAGTLNLEMKIAPESSWILVKTYEASTVEEVVLANYMRVIATDAAQAWLGEIV